MMLIKPVINYARALTKNETRNTEKVLNKRVYMQRVYSQ